MRFSVILLLLAGVYLNDAQIQSAPGGQCSNEEQGSLDWRVKNSEVVITGTIVHIESEGIQQETEDEFDTEFDESSVPSNHPLRHAVALVQLWRVVKGSIEHVTNFSYEGQVNNDNVPDAGMGTPVIKLYGLWNDHVCGSFLNVGNTRIFFLRKLLDARPNIFKAIQTPDTNMETTGSTYLMQLTSSKPTVNDTLESAPPLEKEKKKKKRKGGKGKKGKKKGRKRSRKREGKKKSRRTGGKRSRRRRKTTESAFQSLRNLRRQKRNAMTPLTLPQMRQLPLVKIRRDVDEQRQVLVVSSPPATINLNNLNMIDGIMELV